MATYDYDSFDFTDEEIVSELSRLGYDQFDRDQLQGFKRDLRTLVQAERSKSFSSSDNSYHQHENSRMEHPAYEKENQQAIWRSAYSTERVPFSSRTNQYSSARAPTSPTKAKPAGDQYYSAREQLVTCKYYTDPQQCATDKFCSSHDKLGIDKYYPAQEQSVTDKYYTVHDQPITERYHPTSELLPVDRYTSTKDERPSAIGNYQAVYQYNDEVRDRLTDPYQSVLEESRTLADPYATQCSAADHSGYTGHNAYDSIVDRSAGRLDSLYRPASADGGAARHLDDYWVHPNDRHARSLPVGRIGPTGYSPVKHNLSTLYSTGAEYTDADSGLIDGDPAANTSRLSQASVVKRKVARKLKDGSSEVYEESYINDDVSSTASDDCDSLADRFRTSVSVNSVPKRSQSRSSTGAQSIQRSEVDPARKSVIWPEMKPPVRAGTSKSDPVNNFNKYKQMWNKVKVPEDKSHKNLRWAVREQMLYKDICYEKPRRKFVENKYEVPTDKKRKDLRWRIRSEMAAGVVPSSGPTY